MQGNFRLFYRGKLHVCTFNENAKEKMGHTFFCRTRSLHCRCFFCFRVSGQYPQEQKQQLQAIAMKNELLI